MINIYLCDDEQNQLKRWTALVEKALLINDLDESLACAVTDPYRLLEVLKEKKGCGLYFLDVDLHSDISGLVLAQKIRELDPRGYIVFITTHSEMCYMTFSYKVEAMDFILKDSPDELASRIQQCMIMADQNYKRIQQVNHNQLAVKVEKEIVYLNQDDIVFIESGQEIHKIRIHTTHGIKQIYGTLKELQPALDQRFYRCHNSAIVNSDHAVKFNPKEQLLTLDNGETCKVSFRMVKVFTHLFQHTP